MTVIFAMNCEQILVGIVSDARKDLKALDKDFLDIELKTY